MSRGRRSHFSSAELDFLLASLDQTARQISSLMASLPPNGETYRAALETRQSIIELRQTLRPDVPGPGFKTPG